MAHPRMYDDGDPVLARVREVALAVPEAVERESHGRPTFRAGESGKVFGYFGHGQSGRPRPASILVLAEPAEHAALLADDRFYLPSYLASAGWLGLDFAAAEVDWQEVAELLDGSYRMVAKARLLAVLDATGGPARSPDSRGRT